MILSNFLFRKQSVGITEFKTTQMLLLFMWFLTLSCEGIDGISLSSKEDLELDRQLKLLNKPAIETIQTKYGDTYNCVDFYQQPAFDHPLLKNNKFQFKMQHFNRKENSSRNGFKPEDIWLNGKGCPFGTVPIRKVTKDVLIGWKRMQRFSHNPNVNDRPGVRYAVLQTKSNPHKKYFGGAMTSSKYRQQVHNYQYSSIQMKIQNGLDTIIVGTTVNPMVYKDNETRLFIYTIAGDQQCFNNLCEHPLFIQVSEEVPLDMIFNDTTIRGNLPSIISFFIYKDIYNGNYYLEVFEERIVVGWWPQKFFTALADSASLVEWGGEAYSPLGMPLPPMGSGVTYMRENDRYDAFCSQLKVVDVAHQIVDPDETQIYADKPYCVINWKKVVGFYQYMFFFGENDKPN